MMNKKQVNYKNFKNATHVAMVLILLASIAFHVALWPQYGWNTPVVLFLAFVGVAVQAMVIIPVWLQNIVTFVGLTFFLQQYQ